MRCLVTGAGGFIGGHLVNRLVSRGCDVRAVDIKRADNWWQRNERAQNLSFDLRHWRSCIKMCEGIDLVYNLACDMGGIGYIENHHADCMTAVSINSHMLQAAAHNKVARYFYSSSACVYRADRQSKTQAIALVEADVGPPYWPEKGYGLEKLFSEQICQAYTDEGKLDCRVARFHNVYGPCFDSETEVLTSEGWKFFSEVNASDLIAARDSEGTMVYTQIKAFQQYNYEGPMHKVDHSATNQMVTPDHAVFATWPTTRGTSTPHAEPFARHTVKDTKWDRARMMFTSACTWAGEKLPGRYQLPECRMTDGRRLHKAKQIKMSDWFAFAGWYLSEGSSWITPTNYTVSIVQSPGKKQREIVSLLKKMKYNPYVNGRNIIVSNKQLYEAVQQFAKGSHNKTIPRWMLLANTPLLARLYSTLMAGDGDKSGNRYSTVSKRLADDMSELALKLGKHAWVNREASNIAGIPRHIFRVHISIRPRLVTKKKHRTVCDYAGMVYDVTLEKHHVMMVRREGKPVWSGNCGSWDDGREKAPAAISRKVAEAKLSGSQLIDVWGDGTNTRSYMYVDDCLDGIDRLMDSDVREPINLGSSEMVSVDELIAGVEIAAGYEVVREYDTTQAQGVKGRNSDNTKIQELLGWAPSISLADGLGKTYPWIEEQVRNAIL